MEVSREVPLGTVDRRCLEVCNFPPAAEKLCEFPRVFRLKLIAFFMLPQRFSCVVFNTFHLPPAPPLPMPTFLPLVMTDPLCLLRAALVARQG